MIDTEYQSSHERGWVMQRIAEQRLDAAWMKTMVTQVSLEKCLTAMGAEEAIEKLGQAMRLLNEAKHIIIRFPAEACADMHNAKGGYQTPEQLVAEYRRPIKYQPVGGQG